MTRKLEPQVRKVALDSKRRCGETDCRATDGNADDLEREIAVSEEMVQKRRRLKWRVKLDNFKDR